MSVQLVDGKGEQMVKYPNVRTVFVLLLVVVIASPALAIGTVHGQTPYRVAIIVADDFTGIDLADVATDQFSADSNCTVSLEGQSFAVRGASATPLDMPHGELVTSELQELIDSAGVGDSIQLVTVDVQAKSTQEAANRIEDALNATAADVYVLNMSFVLIPCENIQDFAEFATQAADADQKNDKKESRAIFQRAVVFYNGTAFPAMSQKAQRAQDLDPIQTVLVNWSGTVIPVASAGNFGLDYPFWPGAWGQVISVSASTGDNFTPPSAWDKKKDTPLLMVEGDQPNKPLRVSNYGEIMLPGEYDGPTGPVLGTSFAAPRLSLLMAQYLAQVGGDFCRKDDGSVALAFGKWDNLLLTDAVQKYCPTMAPFVP